MASDSLNNIVYSSNKSGISDFGTSWSCYRNLQLAEFRKSSLESADFRCMNRLTCRTIQNKVFRFNGK